MSDIPSYNRAAVKMRDLDRCVRCGMQGQHWHHRRSRSVRDEHQHCTCNGIWLCQPCHEWVHANPFLARKGGWIVSRHSKPGSEPVLTIQHGRVILTCEGFTREEGKP